MCFLADSSPITSPTGSVLEYGVDSSRFILDTDLTDEISTKGAANARNVLSLPKRSRFPEQIGCLINWIAGAAGRCLRRFAGNLAFLKAVCRYGFLYQWWSSVCRRGRADRCTALGCVRTVPRANLVRRVNYLEAPRMAIAPTFRRWSLNCISRGLVDEYRMARISVLLEHLGYG